MNNQDIKQVKKMLEALLKSEGLVEWIGGYVYGATSTGDPFVILYPAAEHLKEKVCRVYPHQFKRLPAFINTDGIVGDTDGNPSKEKAQRAGIYHECPVFKIVMHLGKDTQMGREKRFGDVLYVSQAAQAPAGSVPIGTQTTVKTEEDDEKARWRVEAATAEDAFFFDTAMLRLAPWYQTSKNVEQFRETMFGAFNGRHTADYVIGMEAYAAERMTLNGSLEPNEAHRRAKEHALAVIREMRKR